MKLKFIFGVIFLMLVTVGVFGSHIVSANEKESKALADINSHLVEPVSSSTPVVMASKSDNKVSQKNTVKKVAAIGKIKSVKSGLYSSKATKSKVAKGKSVKAAGVKVSHTVTHSKSISSTVGKVSVAKAVTSKTKTSKATKSTVLKVSKAPTAKHSVKVKRIA